ncbi:hypothetical protein DCAR_0520564 [Daucus carota subsp. sativus]|uniref:Uncharacterized protein n=1 Tax=Daucus carota subsp. sativus TaxID=79200 RepID=A0AAF0X4E6_DAUCS|nr:PREDICTED: protein GLUTAMINE DUMPER 2-like [Daucus carota subsp. sativus]WOH01183.1 hypothetical protein DCAR_0520564 [Daucus carota subsp. sativus]
MTAVANAPLTMPVQKSPWHSPVPYLFGGLAAMLGLIAFALLILACSYWKLSGSLDSGEADSERDLEAGGDDAKDKKPAPVYEEKFLVIMAGQEKPTYLATPKSSTSRTSSFGSTTSESNTSTCSSNEMCCTFVVQTSSQVLNRDVTDRTAP